MQKALFATVVASAAVLQPSSAATATTHVKEIVRAKDLTTADVLWLAENTWQIHPDVVADLETAHFTLNKLDCSFLSALKSQPFQFMNFQHFCTEAEAALGQKFVRTTTSKDDDEGEGAIVSIVVAAKDTGARRLASEDSWSGITISRNRSAVILGATGDVGMYRTGDSALRLDADLTSFTGSIEVAGSVESASLSVDGTDIADALSTVDSSISSIDSSISSIDSSISSIESDVSSINGDLSTLDGTLSSAVDSISTINSDLSTVDATLSSLAAADDDTDDAIAALQSRVSAVEKSSFCALEACCNDKYSWSGNVLYCWNNAYSAYADDPCSCRAEVFNLGSTTAFAHEQNCVSKGAHLMSIHSQAAGAAVAAYTSATLWIGLYDRKVEGTWHWFDGTSSMYTSWNSGEPNDSSGEDCVHLTGTRQVWNDQDCEENLSISGLCLWQGYGQ